MIDVGSGFFDEMWVIAAFSIKRICKVVRNYLKLGLIHMNFVPWLLTTLLFLSSALNAATGNSVVRVNPPVPAPNWTLPAIQNAEGDLSLSQFKGKITSVDFWASWCGPCRLSLPALNSLNAEFDASKVQFIAVSIDVVEEDAWDFLERYAVDYPVVIDTESDIARLFAVDGMPSGYLLDADGRVREIHIGYKSGDEIKLAKSIRDLLLEMDAS